MLGCTERPLSWCVGHSYKYVCSVSDFFVLPLDMVRSQLGPLSGLRSDQDTRLSILEANLWLVTKAFKTKTCLGLRCKSVIFHFLDFYQNWTLFLFYSLDAYSRTRLMHDDTWQGHGVRTMISHTRNLGNGVSRHWQMHLMRYPRILFLVASSQAYMDCGHKRVELDLYSCI